MPVNCCMAGKVCSSSTVLLISTLFHWKQYEHIALSGTTTLGGSEERGGSTWFGHGVLVRQPAIGRQHQKKCCHLADLFPVLMSVMLECDRQMDEQTDRTVIV